MEDKNMEIVYSNNYGYLEIEPIEDYHAVGEISSKNYNKSLFFSIDIAEQIVLITDNVKIQTSCVFPDMDKMFLIHHLTGSTGAVCKINKLEFTSLVNPTEEIEFLARKNKGKEERWIKKMVGIMQ
jgi:hypothetical protein